MHNQKRQIDLPVSLDPPVEGNYRLRPSDQRDADVSDTTLVRPSLPVPGIVLGSNSTDFLRYRAPV